ncbi:immunity protein YezG family protein [Hymenobacter terrenus]|uniref:immunity protein YezG family protein n=1 Tax=Hymenobacter terrenus TaxID=1629124 RepID=UPI000696D4E7|nr:immunity protein YezG family protein [Hymenobacter terrenus]
MTDEIQSLFQHIGQLAFNSVPTDEWDIITITVRAILPYVEENVTYTHKEKQFVPKAFLINDDDLDYDEQATPSFERLRQLMYNEAPFRGAWYTAVMTITNDGKFDTEFDYDKKPSFDYESEDAEYAKDFEHFPRNEESTPDWLKDIVQKHELKYHEAEPLA